jgi:hypothetical protein
MAPGLRWPACGALTPQTSWSACPSSNSFATAVIVSLKPLLQKTNIPIDVVLSEIDIPGSMNGFGFAQWGPLRPP